MKQRHHRQHARLFGDRLAHDQPHHHGVQHSRAVGIKRALGVARGARGIAQARGGVFVKFGPFETVWLLFQQLFVAQRIQGVFWHMRAVCHDDKAQITGQFAAHSLQNGHKGGIHENQLIFGVIDDVDQLLGRQARVDRVTHRTLAGNRIIQLEMAITVPCQRGHPIAQLHAKRL